MMNSPTEETIPPRKPTGEPATDSPTLAADPGAFVLDTDGVRRVDDEEATAHGEQDLYSGGHISAPIPKWLLVVYVALFAWGLYYAYKYWGGLGPGLDYSIVQIDHLTGRALG
jgi:hypothetical protein